MKLSVSFAFALLLTAGLCEIHYEDGYMLDQLYYSLTFIGLLPWKLGSDYCDPANSGFIPHTTIPTIECDHSKPQRVTKIQLPGMGLVGTIPSDLGSLPALTTLILKDNLFSGTIPDSLGNLNHIITIELQENRLMGSIPAGLLSINMTSLHLGGSNVFCPITDFSHIYDNDFKVTEFCTESLEDEMYLQFLKYRNIGYHQLQNQNRQEAHHSTSSHPQHLKNQTNEGPNSKHLCGDEENEACVLGEHFATEARMDIKFASSNHDHTF